MQRDNFLNTTMTASNNDPVFAAGGRAGAAIGGVASAPVGAARGAVTGVGGLIDRPADGTGAMGDVIDAVGLLSLGSAASAPPREQPDSLRNLHGLLSR